MQVQNRFILDPLFFPAYDKLITTKGIPAKQCLELNVCLDELSAHQNILQRTRRDIVMKYGVKDEKGELKTYPGTPNIVFASQEDENTCKKAIEEITAGTLDIPLTSRVVIAGDDISWTPLELRMLNDIIEVK